MGKTTFSSKILGFSVLLGITVVFLMGFSYITQGTKAENGLASPAKSDKEVINNPREFAFSLEEKGEEKLIAENINSTWKGSTTFIEPTLKDVVGQCEVNGIDAPIITINGNDITGTTSDPLKYSEQGEYEITWTFDDRNGNITTATQKVVVNDTIAPVADVVELSTITGECSATVSTAPTATDNCGGIIQGTTSGTLTYSEQGTYTITWIYDDGNGNTSSQTQTVIVDDTTAPVADVVEIPTVTSECSATVSTVPTATDNCGGIIQGTTSDALTYSEQGTYMITWIYDDGNGNTSSQTQTVIVDDTTAPVADVVELSTISGECSATVSTAPTATDNCGGIIQGTTSDALTYSEQGTYTITWIYDDGNGNTSSQTQTVIVDDTTAPVADVVELQIVTGECSATVSAVPTATDNCGGTIQGTTSDALKYSEQGEYIITWTFDDGKGNISSQTQKIIVDDITAPIPPTIEDITWGCTYTVTPPIAPDNCVGTVTGTANRSLTFSSSGTIIWTFDDGNGNISEVTQKITIDPIRAEAEIANIRCYNSSTGAASIIPSGGVEPYSYSWSREGGGANFIPGAKQSNLPAGNYSVVVSDKNGNCSITKEFEITQPESMNAEVASTNVTCNGANDGSISITNASGGFGSYQFSIDGINWQASGKFQDLSNGLYKILMRDRTEIGCVVVLNPDLEITQPEELKMTTTATASPVSCFGGDDGTITAGTVIGGTPPYSYSINNTDFNETRFFENVSADNHTIFVVDSNGCSLQVPIIVTEPAILDADISKTDVLCFDGESGSITIFNPTGGNGTFQYKITEMTTGKFFDWQSNPTFTALTEGVYEVEIKDPTSGLGCSEVLGTISISQPDAPLDVEISATRTTEYGTPTGTASANAFGGTPGYTYEWTKGGDPDFLRTTKTINNVLSGKYTVVVTDLNGCSTSPETVEIRDYITAEINAASLCEDAEENNLRVSIFSVLYASILGGSGNINDYEFEWDFGENIDQIWETEQGINVRYEPGAGGDRIITLTITDGEEISILEFPHYVGKCFQNCGTSKNFEIDPNSFYIGDVSGNAITEDNCNSEKFLWFNITKSSNVYNLDVTIQYSVGETIDGVTTTYARTASNCFGTNLEESSGNSNNRKKKYNWEQIFPGKYKLFPVGDEESTDGSKIQWKCGQSFILEGMTMRYSNKSNKICGDTSHNACIGLASNTEVITPIIATATPTHVACYGKPLGGIEVSVLGGIPPFTYSIDDGNYQDSNLFPNLLAKESGYTIRVKDSRGTIFKIPNPIIINQPAEPLKATVEIKSEIDCFGDTGILAVTAKGGTPGYTYLWNDPQNQTTATAENLSAGTYTVTIIDANGCQVIESIVITEPEPLTRANAGRDQSFSCGFNTTTLEANEPVNGIGTWSIVPEKSDEGGEILEINNPYSSFIFSPPAGTAEPYIFTLKWTIANEDGTCATSDTMTITFLGDCSKLDFDGDNDYIFFGDNFGLTSGSFSIEAWVKPESVEGTKTILSKRDINSLGTGGYDLIINSGAPTFRWENNSVSTSDKVGTDRWYHIAMIYQNSKIELYVDGIRVGNSSATNPATTNSPFLIGALYNSSTPDVPTNYFDGFIEEVRIWDKALTTDELRFMMNQRLEKVGDNTVQGTVIKNIIFQDNPEALPIKELIWSDLLGYYPLVAKEDSLVGGIIKNKGSVSGAAGILKNIQDMQENTAPLPYILYTTGGNWFEKSTWKLPPELDGQKIDYTDVWDPPSSFGIDGETKINWNIAKIAHDINSDENIKLLGLISEAGVLNMKGSNPKYEDGTTTPGTGNALIVTHYLKLNGIIDLNGESQLIQSPGSILSAESSGYIERDQQGTRNSFNYNYWSSPVSTIGAANNSGFTIGGVLRDGSEPENPLEINFGSGPFYADEGHNNPIGISSYWLNIYTNFESNTYSAWKHVGAKESIKTGVGFTMKGTSAAAAIAERQNYVFIGKPNNGTITLEVEKGHDFLVGNPYPSAIDSDKFIRDNIDEVGEKDSVNVFNGTLYFWDHFGGGSHYLKEYVGGYGALNLLGDGIKAVATDERINATEESATTAPKRFIPVGQGFYVSTQEINPDVEISGGAILFNNSQRVFVPESSEESIFKSKESKNPNRKTADTRKKIWLKFHSPTGYNRQILVGVDSSTTDGFDIGYDAPLFGNNKEDMYWMIQGVEFVIQGVPDFNKEREIALGIKTAAEGKFTIAIDELKNIPEDFEIYLKDSLTKLRFDLRESAFSANATPGKINNRYSIVFQKEPIPGTDGEDGNNEDGDNKEDPEGENTEKPQESGEIRLYFVSKNHEVIIENPQLIPIEKAILYNFLGQELKVFESIEKLKLVRLPIVQNAVGVYIVKLKLEDGSISKQFIIEGK